MIGTVIDKRFKIEELLHRGSLSDIYIAHDKTTDEQVAVRILRPSAADANEFLQRQLQEFRLLKNLNHPNMVRVIQAGLATDHEAYVATELLSGNDLEKEVEINGPISLDRMLNFVEQIAELLDFVHAEKIIHRDIQPSHFKIDTDEDGNEVIKLSGLLLAKVAMPKGSGPGGGGMMMTQAGITVGSPKYMSPEQAMGKPASLLSDIYSLGATIYHGLVGVAPFQAKSDFQTMLCHVEQPFPAFRSRNKNCDVPANVEAVVAKAMSKEPENRYRNAGELAVDFRRAIEDPSFDLSGQLEKTNSFSKIKSRSSAKTTGPKTEAGGGIPTWLISVAIAICVIAGVAIGIAVSSR